jgi:fibronectin-binding autotransporter adhesin
MFVAMENSFRAFIRRFLVSCQSRLARLPQSRRSKRFKCLSAVRAVFEPLEPRLLLSTNSWINSSGGDWDTASNWSLGHVPTATENVVINLAGSYTVTHTTSTADSINSLTIAKSVTLSAGSLTIAAGLTIDSGATLTLDAGTALDFSGSSQTISGSGQIVLDAAGGSLGAAQLNVGASDNLTIDGGITVDDAGIIATSNGSDLSIPGTLNLQSRGRLNIVSGSSGYIGVSDNSTWTNSGTIDVAGGSLVIGSGKYGIVANAGTIDVTGGHFTSSGSYAYLFNNSNTGTIDVTGGTVSIGSYNGNASGGYSNFTNYGTFVASGGVVSIAGYENGAGTVIANDGTITTSGGASLTLDLLGIHDEARAITNSGAINVNGGSVTSYGAYRYQFINSSSGTINVTAGSLSIGSSNGIASGGYIAFVNDGTIDATGGMASLDGYLITNSVFSYAIANDGTITVGGGASVNLDILGNEAGTLSNAGTINVTGGHFTSSGSYEYQFINSNAGAIDVSGGTLSIGGYNGDASGYSVFTNYGTIDATGGAVSIAGYLTTSSTNAPGNPIIANDGTITASGGASVTLSILGNDAGYPASIYVSGSDIINNGTIDVGGGSLAISSGRYSIVTNNGTIDVSNGSLAINTSGGYNQMVNASSGVIDVTGGTLSTGGYINGCSTGYSAFTNYGIIDATGGAVSIAGYVTPNSAFSGAGGPAIANDGTITVGSGSSVSLEILGNYAGTITNSGTISVNGGNFAIDTNGGYNQVINSSVIDVTGGTLNIGGYNEASGYSIFANYGTIDATGGTLSIAGYIGYGNSPSSLVFGNYGTITVGSGASVALDLLSNYAGTLGNSGTINVTGGNLTSTGAYQYQFINSSTGTINVTGGDITLNAPNASGIIITNSGTISGSGTVTLDGVTDNSGTLAAGSGQTLTISTGGYSFSNNGTLQTTGTGHVDINGSVYGTNVSWADQNIGSADGIASFNSTTGIWTQSSSGNGIGSSSDQFNFNSQNWTGSGALVAQISSQSLNSGNAGAGVMFRDSSAAGAIFASLSRSSSNGVSFQWRSSTNGTAQSAGVSNITGTVWVDLVRNGNSISAYYSTNGTTWTQIGTTQTISFSNNTILAGMAVAGNAGQTNTASIGNFQINTAPTVTSTAAASPNPATGTTTNLSVQGADTDGQNNNTLIFTWSVTSKPSGAATPTFSANGTDAAQNTTATFNKAGSYTFLATITDDDGVSTTSSVTVTVNQTLTSIAVSPTSVSLDLLQTEQFSATALDQFGMAMANQPTFTWSVASGVGSISNSGLYASSSTSGAATVKAASNGVSGMASVTVNEILSDATLSQNLTVPSGSTLTVENGLTIDSGVTLTADAGSVIDFAGSSQTVSGSGQIVLDAAGGGFGAAQLSVAGSSETLTFAVGITVSGAGSINGTGSLTNKGIMDANVSGQHLNISVRTANTGTLEATGGGYLSLSSTLALEAGGNLTIGSSSTGHISQSSYITNAGTITINAGSLTVFNQSQTGFSNTGSINVNGGGNLLFDGSISLFANNNSININDGTFTINNAGSSRGGYYLSITNAGTINVTEGSAFLGDVQTYYSSNGGYSIFNNSGTVNAQGGYISIGAYITSGDARNTSGFNSFMNYGLVPVLNDGTIESNDDGSINIISGGTYNDLVANAGAIDVTSGGIAINTGGYNQMINASSGYIHVTGGTLSIGGYNGASGFSLFTNYGTLDATGGAISIAGYSTPYSAVNINGSGPDIVNDGLITVGSGASVSLDILSDYAGAVANSGYIEVTGGTLTSSGSYKYQFINSGYVGVYSGTASIGGYHGNASGYSLFTNYGFIFNSGTTLSIAGYSTPYSNNAPSGPAIVNAGEIDIDGGSMSLNILGNYAGTVANSGSIYIYGIGTNGSHLSSSGDYQYQFINSYGGFIDLGGGTLSIGGYSGDPSGYSLFTNDGTIDASFGAVSIAGYLTTNSTNAPGNPVIANAGTMIVNDGASVTLSILSNDADSPASLSVPGSDILNSGTIIVRGGSMAMSSGRYSTMTNSGTIEVITGNLITTNSSLAINTSGGYNQMINSSSGVIDVSRDGTLSIGGYNHNGNSTGYSAFTNFGTIDATGGAVSIAGYVTPSSEFSGAGGPAIANDGTITVGSGASLSLNILGNYAGTVTNSGTINVSGGNLTSSGAYQYQFINSSSKTINVTGGGTLSIGGYYGNARGFSLFRNHGTIEATGSTITIAGYLTPDSTDAPSGPAIANEGTITAGGGATISINIVGGYAGGIINSGTINANGSDIILNASTASGSYLMNSGTISAENNGEINIEVPASNDFTNTGSTTTSGGGLIYIYLVSNYSNATLNSKLTVLPGDMLLIENGLTIDSGVTLTVDAGAAINFTNYESQSISGGGQIVLDAAADGFGAALLNMGISDALTINSGITLDDAGSINTFYGSSLSIQGSSLNLQSSGRLNIVSGSSGVIGVSGNNTWTNNGTIDVAGGSLAIGTSGGYNQMINSSSGVIDVSGGTLSIGGYFYDGYTNTNHGTIDAPYSYFTNDGTIDATGGTILISGSGYGSGDFIVNNGTISSAGGAAVTLSVKGYVDDDGALLNSSTGVINADGGTISVGGYNNENSLYTTFINYGSLEASSAGGSLDILSGNVTLESSGLVTVAGNASVNVYIPTNYYGYDIFINNAGTISGSGQVNLDGVTTNSGTFEAGNGQTLFIGTGGYSLTNTGTLQTTGTGNVDINETIFGADVSWKDQNIGNSPAAGLASYNSNAGAWTLSSAGDGVGSGSDQFNFNSQSWTGNGTLSAEVNNESLNGGTAGVMFRNSSAPGAVFASVVLSPTNGVEFQYRTTTNGTAGNSTVSGVSGPVWVEIERSDNGSGGYNVSGYYSTNGTTWTQIGTTQTITFSNNTILAGMTVAGNGSSNTATINDFTDYYTVPPEIQAGYATIPNEVQVNWNAVSGATSYTLWRSATDLVNSATVLAGGLTGTSYLDTTASTTNVEYYWVTAMYGSQTGGYGGPAMGLAELAAPGDVTATNNVLNEIQVAWNAVAGSTAYNVFRNTSNNFSSATEIAPGLTGTSYTDTSASAQTTYYYWIQAINTIQNGAISGSAAGEVLSVISGPYTPYQMREAYQFNELSFTNSLHQSVTADGAGQTIAIIDAYDDYTIFSDLDTFDQNMSFDNQSSLYQEFGPASSFLTQKAMSTQFPGLYPYMSWVAETSLDVEWAHAIAPAAQILLVEAQNNSLGALFNAVNYAKSISSVDVISMSWGGSEFPSESGYDSLFNTPAGHQGITFVASAGDTGGFTEYPAVSPNVLSVGGTTLNLTSNGNWYSESAWGDGVISDEGGGGGLSEYESQPTYQSGVEPDTTMLAAPDVSYDANPSTGVSIVYTIPFYGIGTNWTQIGGTSAGAPQWAALIAIADQGRELAGKTSLDGPSQLLPALFALYSTPAYSSDFHDITTGSNGYPAGSGFDLATGLGSPIASNLIPYLVGLSNATPPSSDGGSNTQNFSGGSSNSFQENPLLFNTGQTENMIEEVDSPSYDDSLVFLQPVKAALPSAAGQLIHLAAPASTTIPGVINGLQLAPLFNPLDELKLGSAIV